MQDINNLEQSRENNRTFLSYLLPVVFMSLVALSATFLLANSPVELTAKALGFAGIILAFLFACASLHLSQIMTSTDNDISKQTSAPRIDGLAALEEAGEFFAGSLGSADAFRLFANRIRDILPARSMVLFLLDGTRTRLRVAESDGPEALDETIGLGEGLPDQCFAKRHIEIDNYLAMDAEQDLGSAAAIPLFHGTEIFGVLQLYFDSDFDMQIANKEIFEAVGTRVGPLILGSIAFEQSQANALTDVTTDLPNERAFYMILENKLAQAQCKKDGQPLTVLAIDIKNFNEINERFGHAAGDRALNFVAWVVKDNLRQMDFLARSIGDEFLAVLPTASQDMTREIIERINTGFVGRRFQVTGEESIEIEVTIGWSVFGSDGETPGQLLSLAQLRKAQAKSPEQGNVLWFPRAQEVVN